MLTDNGRPSINTLSGSRVKISVNQGVLMWTYSSMSRCALAVVGVGIFIAGAIIYTKERPSSIYLFLLERIESLHPFRIYFQEFKRQWWAIVWGESIVAIVFVLWWSVTVNAQNGVMIIFFALAGMVASYYAWLP